MQCSPTVCHLLLSLPPGKTVSYQIAGRFRANAQFSSPPLKSKGSAYQKHFTMEVLIEINRGIPFIREIISRWQNQIV